MDFRRISRGFGRFCYFGLEGADWVPVGIGNRLGGTSFTTSTKTLPTEWISKRFLLKQHRSTREIHQHFVKFRGFPNHPKLITTEAAVNRDWLVFEYNLVKIPTVQSNRDNDNNHTLAAG